MVRNLLIATAMVALVSLTAAPVSAQYDPGHMNYDLFSQYATPNGPNMTTAGMYPAPHYVPPMGGQAYYTYQPLMPHEMMYQHSRNYYNYYGTNANGVGPTSLTKTTVKWQSGTNHMGPLKHGRCLSDCLYRLQACKYGLCGVAKHGKCKDGSCGHGHFGHGHHGHLKRHFAKHRCANGTCAADNCECGAYGN